MKKIVLAAAFKFPLLLLKEWMAPAMLNLEGLVLYAAPSIKTISYKTTEKDVLHVDSDW